MPGQPLHRHGIEQRGAVLDPGLQGAVVSLFEHDPQVEGHSDLRGRGVRVAGGIIRALATRARVGAVAEEDLEERGA